jgi:hypothetical protein
MMKIATKIVDKIVVQTADPVKDPTAEKHS